LKNIRIDEIQSKIKAIEAEKKNLIEELLALQSNNDIPASKGTNALDKIPETPVEKISLFLNLFRCREDVYPKLWENQNKGKKGYSPVCKNEWIPDICHKSESKCSDCDNKNFAVFDDEVANLHLKGKITVGTYAIKPDDTCKFLVADFDKTTWKDDAFAYKQAARELGVEVAIERSRSGNGGHAWIFFAEPIAARLARQLGSIIISNALSKLHSISLESYDRFFPSQDYIPRGGFGNLIALPLQKKPRDLGNSVFLDDTFEPYTDQWSYLTQMKLLSYEDTITIINETLPERDTPYTSLFEDRDIKIAERTIEKANERLIPESFNKEIKFRIGSHLIVNIENIPSALIWAFKRTSTFANPKFFELQKLRLSTWKTPKYIFCGEIIGDDLFLPRGTLDSCLEICSKVGAKVIIRDERLNPKRLKLTFKATLFKEQQLTINEIIKHENGVLVAPPGSGKTVMACAIIAKRKTPTLILVHRSPLMDQWRTQLSDLLGIDKKEIGVYGGSKKKLTGTIDIAMLQSLSNIENPDELFQNYGQVIIDECHHIPAFSFEQVLKKTPAKFILGLTATPYRKDGHQAILFMQCGPIRFEMKNFTQVQLNKVVFVRETGFQMPPSELIQHPIHEVWEKLVNDENRLNLIAKDVKAILEDGRFPLIISERKDHLAAISKAIKKITGDNILEFIFVGDMGKKARIKAIEDINSNIGSGKRPYLLATGSLIGEGFDLPPLDTLVITMPVAFKGKIVQYAGRLHREYEGKKDVRICDYFDGSMGLTVSMYKKRITAYKKMGYKIETIAGTKSNRMTFNNGNLFNYVHDQKTEVSK